MANQFDAKLVLSLLQLARTNHIGKELYVIPTLSKDVDANLEFAFRGESCFLKMKALHGVSGYTDFMFECRLPETSAVTDYHRSLFVAEKPKKVSINDIINGSGEEVLRYSKRLLDYESNQALLHDYSFYGTSILWKPNQSPSADCFSYEQGAVFVTKHGKDAIDKVKHGLQCYVEFQTTQPHTPDKSADVTHAFQVIRDSVSQANPTNKEAILRKLESAANEGMKTFSKLKFKR